MTRNHPLCETCLFWSKKTEECRRRAPGRSSVGTDATWPRTEKDDWCGEHEPADAPAADGKE